MSPAVPHETHASPSKKPLKHLWRVMTILIAWAVIGFLITIMDWEQFGEHLRNLSPVTLIAALILYLLLNFFRSLRYMALLAGRDIPMRWMFPIGMYHNFLVRILPFKLGELSYIMLLRNHLNIRLEEGVSSLFGARILELLVIVLAGAVSLFISGELFPGQRELEALFIVLVVAAGIPALYFAGALIRIAARLLALIPSKMIVPLCSWLEGLAAQFDRLRQPGLFARAFFWSLGTYSCSFGVNLVLLSAAGVRLDFAILVVVITMGMFAGAFPFNISGFGMVEISWTFGLTALAGFTAGEAASIGLLLNGTVILMSVIFGVMGWAALRWMTRTDAKNPVQ